MAGRLSPHLRTVQRLNEIPHRYPKIRVATMSVTVAILYAIPLVGLARLDLWSGRHWALFSPSNFVYGAGAIVLSIAAFYVATLLINAAAGRLFCGFGCPVGQISRFGDDAEIGRATKKGRLVAEAKAVGFAMVLAGAGFLWLSDPRVLVEGSPSALAKVAGLFLAGTGVFYAHGRFFRWKFCQGYCPIGIYYSAVQVSHKFGIHFDEVNADCKGCEVCALACPVSLQPTDLTQPLNGLPGIGIEGFPQSNHCLTCGACVQACEDVSKNKPLIPLTLSRKPDARRPNPSPAKSPEKKPAQPVKVAVVAEPPAKAAREPLPRAEPAVDA